MSESLAENYARGGFNRGAGVDCVAAFDSPRAGAGIFHPSNF